MASQLYTAPPATPFSPVISRRPGVVLRPGLWGRGEGEGEGGPGCPPEQALSLSVKILPAGSCGGGSRVDVDVCAWCGGCLLWVWGWSEQRGENSECGYVHEYGENVLFVGTWMDVRVCKEERGCVCAHREGVVV